MPSPAGKRLTNSQEDYLEAIWLLIDEHQVARVRDIASHLDVGMPSVTAALKALSKRGLVNYDPYQVITLTDTGRRLAGEVHRRHQVIRRFLIDILGMEDEAAEANACRMEHAVDKTLLDRLAEFAEFVETCPLAGEKWSREFAEGCWKDPDGIRCRNCHARASDAVRKKR